MIDCYGCGRPMKYAWATFGNTAYCVVCDVVRRLKGIKPGKHEKGTLSNGTLTMRQRSQGENA